MRTEITKLGEVVSRSCGRQAASVCISVAIQRERLLFRQYRCCCRRDRRHRHRHRRWRWYTFLEKFMSSTIPFCRFFLLCITNETEWKKNKKKTNSRRLLHYSETSAEKQRLHKVRQREWKREIHGTRWNMWWAEEVAMHCEVRLLNMQFFMQLYIHIIDWIVLRTQWKLQCHAHCTRCTRQHAACLLTTNRAVRSASSHR